jgi:hypothetical protein
MKVLVIGRARTVWDEVTAAKAMTEFDKVVVVNVAGQDYPGRIDYWVSFHPGFFGIWIDKRKKAGHPYSPGQPQLWSSTHNGRKLAEQFKEIAVQHTNHMGGSSGLLGAWVRLFSAAYRWRTRLVTMIGLCGGKPWSTGKRG